ncbi:hypothetical protein B0J17DRAFT_305705 [Rhizoctonia solani]|nr:hypothetical protein B0J17DRAFT_305705 [Rhizoctonia solani]
MVTQDQVNYLPIDITHLTEAQSIRKGVLSGLPIPESVQSNFAIYYSTSNDFSKSTALDDNQLFVRCRRSGDEMGSVKLLVRRITTPSSSNTQTTSNRPRSSSTIIEPLRVSIPLSHPKPSSHSPSASGPSPRTESAPPLGGQLIADRLPTPNWNVADNIQSTNHRIQLHSSPQVLCPTAGRSRYSSLVNMPNRRNSDVSASPATLLALKFKSGYSTSALNAGAPRSAPNVSYTPDFHPLKGTTGSRETHIGFGTGTLESVDEGRRVQVKKLLDDLVEQPAKSLGLSIHLAESSRESHYQGEKGAINYQTKTKLVIDGLAISGSVGPSTASHTPNSASNDHGQGGMVCKIIDLKPIDNSVVINGEMPVTEILKHLHNHGCSNVTSQLGNYEASQYPAATGGFGEIYLGKLPDGRRIGLKCFRLLIDTTDDGHKKLKVRTNNKVITD